MNVVGSEGGSWGIRIQVTAPLVQEGSNGGRVGRVQRKVDKYTRNLGGELGSVSRVAVCGGEGRRTVKASNVRLLAEAHGRMELSSADKERT